MGKTTCMKLKGSKGLRQRLLLSTLSSTPVLIEDIRADATWPGLRSHEVSFLRLLETICDDCKVEINETGTKLKYKPGVVMGGKNLVHDCGVSRSIGYFLEPLLVLGLFGKKPLSIRLKGITNDSKDPSVDTFRLTTIQILKLFGVPPEGLELKIDSRGVAPNGGGEVVLSVPIVHNSLTAVTWIDEGMVKRIRGVTFSTRVSVQFENTMIHAARGIFNRLLPDVHIFTDHKTGAQSGNSPGYGISLVVETSSGCFISADTAISYAQAEEEGGFNDEEKTKLTPPEDVGEQIASLLLGEIEQGGLVDSTHQGLLFLLCALCPQDVSKVRGGKLSPYGIETLGDIRDFLGVKFVIKPDPSTGKLAMPQLLATTYHQCRWNYTDGEDVQNGLMKEAIGVFYDIRIEGIKSTRVTLVSFLSASANLCVLEEDKQGHAIAILSRMDLDDILGTSITNLYSKIGLIRNVEIVFSRMLEKDNVTWNLLISFYVHHGQSERAIHLCRLLREAHCYCFKNDLVFEVAIVSSIVVYAKCGNLEQAKLVSDMASTKHLAMYNAMVSGYALHGVGKGVHGYVLKLSFEDCVFVASSLVVLYGNVEHRELHNACGYYFHMTAASGLIKRENEKDRPFILYCLSLSFQLLESCLV